MFRPLCVKLIFQSSKCPQSVRSDHFYESEQRISCDPYCGVQKLDCELTLFILNNSITSHTVSLPLTQLNIHRFQTVLP